MPTDNEQKAFNADQQADEWEPMPHHTGVAIPVSEALASLDLEKPVLQSTTSLAGQYAQLHNQKRDLEAQAKKIAEKMAGIEAQLLEQYSAEGIQTIKTQWGTVYLAHDVRASCQDPVLLGTTEWEYLVKQTVNGNSLAAAVRECEYHEESGRYVLPEAVIEECITITDVYQIRVRKA